MLADDDPQNRRTAAITLGWLKEPRAERPLIELLGDSALQEYVTHALVSIGFQDRAAYAYGLDHPDDARCGRGRSAAWPGSRPPAASTSWPRSSTTRRRRCARRRRPRSAAWATRTRPCCSSSCWATRASSSRRAPWARSRACRPQRVPPLLLQALGSPEVPGAHPRRRDAGPPAPGRTAPALIALSRDPRETVRRAAIKALGEIDAAGRARPAARRALRREQRSSASRRCSSLGKLQEPETASDLLPLLDDPDPRMRFVTLRALGQIRNAEAVPRLVPFLADARKELRFAAVEALGAMRAVAAVEPLVRVLTDPDRNLRRVAAESLGIIGDPQAVPPLLLALEDEHWSVRCAAATALGRIGSAQGDAAASGPPGATRTPTVRRAVVAALGEIGDARAAGRLVQALHDPALQTTALEALRAHRACPRCPEMERAFAVRHSRRCGACWWTSSASSRTARAGSCCWPRSPTTAPRCARRPPSPWATDRFLEAVRPLMDLKASDPSPQVRQAAALALKKLTPR